MKYCDVCQSTYPSEFTSCPKDKAPLHPVTEFTPGLIIRDKYEILEKIGVGGMATVYRAKHVTFNEIKAIKVVSSKLMDDEAFLKRFKTEAIITRKLRHPNAVALEDFDTTADGRPFIVMEYVQGRNLRSLIQDMGALPIARAFNIAKQVASALGAAHKLHIVHRDIKPDNIIIIPQPQGAESQDLVKVFDFGIAKMRSSGSDVATGTATQTGMVVGTPQYVSPEQASGKIGDSIDGRSDLYSLGVVLYEMVTGHLPFTSDTPVGYLIHHLQTAPTPPQGLKPPVRLPESVSSLLMKALEKDRNQRFQNAEEFIAALSKPQAVAAATAVMGSDSLNAPTVRTPAGVRSSAGHPAVARPPAPVPPAARPAHAAAKPVAHQDIDQTSETVYGGDETHYQKKHVPELPWKKIGVAAVVLLALILGVSVITNRSLSSGGSAAATQSTNAEDDALIKQQIEDAFAGSDSLKHQKINVAVEGGKVTLSGRVERAYESEIANDLAKDVSGVQGLKNDIVVQEAPEQHEQVWRSEAKKSAAATTPSPAGNAQPTRTQTYQQNRQSVDPATRQQIRTFNQRGYQRLRNGDYNGAERAFRNALKLEPSNPLAQQGLRRAQMGAAGGMTR
ncbi:MAG TPA: protein kinase [Terriglobales bacterium]|nr:protein kinase [Terriglobales bacterium]